MDYVTHTQNSILTASKLISKLCPEILAIPGMSSPRVRHFLNNVLEMENARYLEIGVWMGSTFISAMYKNKPTQANCIDNFSEKNEYTACRDLFFLFCKKFLNPESYKFIEGDSFQIDISQIKLPVNVYFYDGSHTVESQEKALIYYNDVLDDTFIYIVDDYNFPEVPLGTQSGIKKMNYHIDFETVLSARFNGDCENWWNGLYVSVLRKKGR